MDTVFSYDRTKRHHVRQAGALACMESAGLSQLSVIHAALTTPVRSP